MKGICLIAVIFLLTNLLYAQTEQGNWLVGATSNMGLNFGSEKDIDANGNSTQIEKTTTFNITPEVGYFFIHDLAAGLMFNLFTQTINPQNGSNTTNNLFDIGPFVRYYYDLNGSKFKPFANADIDFGGSNTKTGPNESKYDIFGWGLDLGVDYFLNNTVAIEGSIGYMSNTFKDKETSIKHRTGTFGINFGISIILGAK